MASKNLLLKDSVVGKRYQVVKKIGKGSFGEVYEGVDLRTNKAVAIKVEPLKAKHALLPSERDIYNLLKGGTGVPKIKFYGKGKYYRALVMNLLGPNLEELHEHCSKRFTLKTVLMIADQMLERIRYIHKKTFIHMDIKPENFLVGTETDDPLIYVIDLGIAKNYIDSRTKKHIPFKQHATFTGAAIYSSVNVHNGDEQSRRDDIESIGYVLIHFCKGQLPWEALKAASGQKLFEKLSEKKMSITVKELCKGLPDEFNMFMNYCRDLDFTDEPDYKYLRCLFSDLFKRRGFKNDLVFDWDH